VLLDVDGYWDPFVALLDRAVDAGFLRAMHRDLAHRAATATDALDLLTAPPPPATHKWIDRDDV
jgi:predicted Rossmann-fold nucleotide-binding protein